MLHEMMSVWDMKLSENGCLGVCLLKLVSLRALFGFMCDDIKLVIPTKAIRRKNNIN